MLEHYDMSSRQEILQQWKMEVKEGLEAVIGSSVDPALDLDIIIVASKYESYPLSLQDDPNAQPYRSTDLQTSKQNIQSLLL